MENVHEARYWRRLPNGRIQCDLCPRECTLDEGQRGLCFVRARRGEGMVLTTYALASGFCLDPIEKKPLNHFLPGTSVLSFGTAGCNLTCKFCQNWHMSKTRDAAALSQKATPEAIALAAERLGAPSVAMTYNDPVIYHEFAVDTARACRRRGIRAVAVTAGYLNPEPAVEFFSVMDGANVDLKGFSESFYHRLTGGHLQPVLEVLIHLKRHTTVWVELTTLLIPGENDSAVELRAMGEWIGRELGPETPLHFTAFHPDWKLQDHPPTSPESLRQARTIARECGLRYVYTGNVRDREGGSTHCHHCGHLLIDRDSWTLRGWGLTPEGRCQRCGTPCAGVFQATPGTWGARRIPVTLE
ncbi:MAG: AmmeMemoRadiSam system radical SAM enzyme [Magnetococcales bacterium]|nr:AmmeMemoRadiSam system radical SAM enzyme [Magnetococcales bacterium]